ncbi:MAG TPA: hypothetical protein PKE12_03060 [Kiritimatiellia bacterium]|nr:hypothetical protein [Kiritimatiellia bacterium]
MSGVKCVRAMLALCAVAGLARAEPALVAPVPNRWVPQGEVQLFNAPEETRIAVVLHTRFIDRVLRTIATKERGNWGEHPDAQRYIAALDTARTSALVRVKGASHESLIIEFVDTRTSGVVSVSAAAVNAGGGASHLRAEPVAVLASFVPDTGYLRRNMALILADQLGITPEAAAIRLQPPRADPR